MSTDPIAPDTKDWTWTTQRRCAECGFDASTVAAADLGDLIPALTAPWQDVLTREDVRVRPQPTTWSPLEYAAHVHEVLDVFAGRFELVLSEDNPLLPNWDQDAASIEGDYAAQDPVVLAREIPERTTALVAILARFDGGGSPEGVRNLDENAGEACETSIFLWGRGAQRSDGAEFTALSLARYLVHDLAHHLHDVGAGDRLPASGAADA